MHQAIPVLAGFAALAAAVPHPGRHALDHAHFHGRAVEMPKPRRAFPPLLERTISYDGSCGSWSGMTCTSGYCCSSLGWCGNSADACGAGCQEGFGDCASSGGDAGPSSAVSAAGVAPSPYQPPTYSAPPPEPSTTIQTAPIQPSTTTYAAPPPPTTLATTSTVAPEPVSYAPTTTTPAASAPTSAGGSGKGNTYTFYQGDGSMGAGWPAESDWLSFDDMWSANLEDLISQSCSQFGQANNQADESDNIKSAIGSIGQQTSVDPRFILAIIVQESKGCVRVPTTSWSVANPGLMQSHDGSGSCNSGSSVQDPCPMSEITQMIHDGTAGTSSGDGLSQILTTCTADSAQRYYEAARIYNSGSIDASGDLGAGGATHCYSSDIANRLTGWTDASSTCTL